MSVIKLERTPREDLARATRRTLRSMAKYDERSEECWQRPVWIAWALCWPPCSPCRAHCHWLGIYILSSILFCASDSGAVTVGDHVMSEAGLCLPGALWPPAPLKMPPRTTPPPPDPFYCSPFGSPYFNRYRLHMKVPGQKRLSENNIDTEWGRKTSDYELLWGYEVEKQHASSRKHEEECKHKLFSSQLQLNLVRKCTAGSQDCGAIY
ncbi:hypothetical protein J6590_015608 [Homalodisca vitripennis]|nr:hypothetical protein J6590_015608 [Homalodisca vitripennis]